MMGAASKCPLGITKPVGQWAASSSLSLSQTYGVTLTVSHYTYVDLKDAPQIVELAVRVAVDRNLTAGCNRNVGEGWECRQELAKQLQNLERILSVQRFLIFKGFNQLHAKLNRYLAIQVRSFVVVVGGGGGGVGVVVERVVTSAYWNAQCQHKLAADCHLERGDW